MCNLPPRRPVEAGSMEIFETIEDFFGFYQSDVRGKEA